MRQAELLTSPVLGLPRVPRSVISRPRLSELIDGLLVEHDLVVLRSPAGTGKTVALADWASSGITKGHISWFTLDEHYADRTSFWREMIHGTVRRVDEPIRPMISECAEALSAGANIRTVLRRFVSLVPETIIVIDRLDFINDDSLLEDMAWALQNSRSIKAVVTARSRSILESPAMALVMDVAIVGPEPFQLTVDETRALLEKRGLPTDAEALHTATGGHPMLTRATMAVHDPCDPASLSSSVETAVADFLSISLTEARLGPEVQDFMVRTSIPESFTLDLARQLSGVSNPTAILDDLEDQGLGLWFRYASTRRFRYGIAVRTMLHKSLKKIDPREIDRMTHAVIVHDLACGNVTSALRQAVAIGDLDLTSKIACDHHMTLLVSQAKEVLEILESVPLTRLRRHPALIMALALCHNSTADGRFRALELFGLAVVFARVYRSSMDAGQRIWMLTLESTALRFSGKLEPAVKYANLAVQAFEEGTLELRGQLSALEPSLYTQAAIACIHDQRFDTAARLLTQALNAARRTQSLPSIFLGTGLLAFTLAQAGKIREARVHLAWLTESRWPPGMLDGYWATTYRLAQVREAMDRQAYAEAAGYLSMINDEMKVSEFWPYIVSYQMFLDLPRAGAAPSPASLDTKIKEAGKVPLNNSGAVELDCLRASIHLIAGHPTRAASVLAKHTKTIPRVLIMRARIALFLDDPARTLVLTRRAGPDLDPRMELHRLVLRTAALLRTGDGTTAKDYAAAAASLMKLHGLTMTAALVPSEDMAAVAELVRAVEPGILQPIYLGPSKVETVSLTPRERVVLDALSVHDTEVDVARALSVSVNTVKSQRRSILKKLGASSREEALAKARHQGLLED